MRNEYYMKEYYHFNCDYNVIFNLIEVNTESMIATVAVNNLGKLTQETVELRGVNDNPYFEYGIMNDKIYIDEFEIVGGDAV